MTDTATQIAELREKVGRAHEEQADIEYYSGSSSVNHAQRALGAWAMRHVLPIIDAQAAEIEALRAERDRLRRGLELLATERDKDGAATGAAIVAQDYLKQAAAITGSAQR